MKRLPYILSIFFFILPYKTYAETIKKQDFSNFYVNLIHINYLYIEHNIIKDQTDLLRQKAYLSKEIYQERDRVLFCMQIINKYAYNNFFYHTKSILKYDEKAKIEVKNNEEYFKELISGDQLDKCSNSDGADEYLEDLLKIFYYTD